MKKENTDLKSVLSQVETTLNLYLVKKAPALPENVKELIVKYSPYLAIVGLVFSVPSLLALFGLGSLINRYAYLSGAYYGPSFSISVIFLLISVVLMGLAIPGLFARKVSAWNLMFYSSLVSAVYNLLRFDLGSLIIGTAISLYFLFQVKSYYK